MLSRLVQHPIVQRLFSIDARSLVFARIGAGLVLLFDLMWRLPHLRSFYTSTGIFPRPGFAPYGLDTWSFHTLIDSGYWVGALFLVHALFAVFMTVGYRARLATVMVFVLYISMRHANIFAYSPGQQLESLLLFLGIFLDWGNVKFRGVFASPHPQKILSFWSAAAVIQVVTLEFVAGLHKSGLSWQTGMSGINAMTSLSVGTDIGMFLAAHIAPIIILGTYAVVTLQLLSPFFLLSPVYTRYTRTAMLTVLELMHLSFGFMLRIGWFPVVAVLALSLLTPSGVWDSMSQAFRKFFGRWLIPENRESPVVVDTLPNDQFQRALLRFVSSGMALVFICFVIVWNTENVLTTNKGIQANDFQHMYFSGAAVLGIDQSWSLFAPDVRRYTYWPSVLVFDRAGNIYDALLKGPPDASAAGAKEAYGSVIWTDIFRFALQPGNRRLARSVTRYFCTVPLPSRGAEYPVFVQTNVLSVGTGGMTTSTPIASAHCK